MQIFKIPPAQNLAQLTIMPDRYGSARVSAVMTISSAMQGSSEQHEYGSVEEAEQAGKAFAERHRADVFVIVGGVS